MKYIGKDIIHWGFGLELNPKTAIDKISYASRKHVKKFANLDVQVKKCQGTPEELTTMKSIWYFPDDPNFPQKLGKKDIMYLAYDKDELLGGVILIPVGGHLFLNNLAASEKGKKLQIQSYLLWHVVNEYADGEYTYIDVGVSYRPNLYRFFRNWATFTYPVIFHPPQIRPRVSFQVFQSMRETEMPEINEDKINAFCKNNKYTIVPDVAHAREIAKTLGRNFTEPPFPQADDGRLQVVDLTRCIPIQYGALLVGIELSEQDLWQEYACFDFVKTKFIKHQLSHASNSRESILKKRKKIFSSYERHFAGEDVSLQANDDWYSAAIFTGGFVEQFAKACKKFAVGHKFVRDRLLLPCHQNVSVKDVEYVYAIYRGVLNLCSEWTPTHVKGVLKN